MFTKLFARNAHTVSTDELMQLNLDVLRTQYANDQAMQLHLDRAQTALSSTRNR